MGLVLALNTCAAVSAYGFILTNDATYYDDEQSTMWTGWQGDGLYSDGLYSYGLEGYGLYSYGLDGVDRLAR